MMQTRLRYYHNLTLAYYVGQRYDEALKAVSRYEGDFPALFAVICVRLGRLDEAQGSRGRAQGRGQTVDHDASAI